MAGSSPAMTRRVGRDEESRPSESETRDLAVKDVDGRVKPGHDEDGGASTL
jgi:hypothetical protein